MKCKYFKIHELVPKHIYETKGEKAWNLLDDRLLKTIDDIRYKFGSMTINNYKWNGNREWSGLRTIESPYYSETSQHSFGRAVDMLPNDDVAVEEIRQYIINHKDEFPYIKGIELNVNWLHIDVRNEDKLLLFEAKN